MTNPLILSGALFYVNSSTFFLGISSDTISFLSIRNKLCLSKINSTFETSLYCLLRVYIYYIKKKDYYKTRNEFGDEQNKRKVRFGMIDSLL